MIKNLITKEGDSISQVWLDVFQELTQTGVEGLSNLSISIRIKPTMPIEDHSLRMILDEALIKNGLFKTQTTSNTIFPPCWNPSKSKEEFFERYLRILPKLKKLSNWNHNGMYFERLVKYCPKGLTDAHHINQLSHIINTFRKGNHRQSALQAIIFDPSRDHTDQRRRGFPCLQQVIFSHGKKNNLSITGIYSKQFIFDRAYGNYLGLYYLGSFMAHEMGLTLTEINCYSNYAVLGTINKSQAKKLLLLLF